MTADLKSAAGIELVLELARTADVLVENFRPGVMDRLGLAAERLLAANPRLVILSISGFGTAGPEAGRVGYDQILPGRPLKFSRSTPSAPLPPPTLGQHDNEVRQHLWGEPHP